MQHSQCTCSPHPPTYLHVEHGEFRSVQSEGAGVGCLASGLGVKGRCVEDHPHSRLAAADVLAGVEECLAVVDRPHVDRRGRTPLVPAKKTKEGAQFRVMKDH